jgi:hypothetical protein
VKNVKKLGPRLTQRGHALHLYCLPRTCTACPAPVLQVFCYALSPPDGSEWRRRIEGEAEHFIDVSGERKLLSVG